MNINKIAEKISAAGGDIFLVGGAIRDKFLGKESHDHDFVVVGMTEEQFLKTLDGMPQRTGLQFPVFRMMATVYSSEEEEIEIALARKEEKIGNGHNGFKMTFNESITIEEDLARRDTTMNSIAQNVLTGFVIDPFGGQRDIEHGVIRATSEHFVEDPLRVLRVARQAAQFNFQVSDETIELMRSCKKELKFLPLSRIWGEMEKALMTRKPSVFFAILEEAGALEEVYPELHQLIGQTQPPQYHPEGDAFNHSLLVLDKVSEQTEDIEARFAALFHDIGKSKTPKELLPEHHGHDKVGARMMEKWDTMRFPTVLRRAAIAVARRHMAVTTVQKPGKIVDILMDMSRRCKPSTMRAVVWADAGVRPSFLEDDFIETVMKKVEVPEELQKTKDGARIKEFVRQVRIGRVRKILR